MQQQRRRTLDITTYNPQNMVFSQPKDEAYKSRRISISTKHSDGSTGELMFKTNRVSSNGITEWENEETNKSSYTLGLFLWSKNGCLPEEKDWSDSFEAIVDKCKDYLLSIKKELKLPSLDRSDMKKLSPLKWKLDDDGNVSGGPSLFPKVWTSYDKKTGELKNFTSLINADTNQPLELSSLMRKMCRVRAAVRVESLFINSAGKITLCVKVLEASIKILDDMSSRLLSPSPERESTAVTERQLEPSRIQVYLSDDDDFEEEEEIKQLEVKKKTARGRKQ
jgi:hypothetical protein